VALAKISHRTACFCSEIITAAHHTVIEGSKYQPS